MRSRKSTGESGETSDVRHPVKLHASGVSVVKGGVHILDDVDLEIQAGTFVALVGPSGAGKSTLLGLLAGLEEPTAGEILKDGELLARPDAVSFMPQSDLLLPWRSVLANTALGLEATGVPKKKARATAMEALGRFGLDDFAKVSPRALSGGMRSRVALLRTALLGRDVLLLDEPFGALDEITRRDLRSWLLDVRSELAATIVLVTHDADEALLLADRVVVLSRRPARIAADIAVPFDRPRKSDAETTEEFTRLKEELLSHLEGRT